VLSSFETEMFERAKGPAAQSYRGLRAFNARGCPADVRQEPVEHDPDQVSMRMGVPLPEQGVAARLTMRLAIDVVVEWYSN
jgi:hypothetical protein